MHTFDLLIVKGDTLRLLNLLTFSCLRLIIVDESTINNHILQQIQLLIVECRSVCRHQISLDQRPLQKKLRIQELQLTELAPK